MTRGKEFVCFDLFTPVIDDTIQLPSEVKQTLLEPCKTCKILKALRVIAGPGPYHCWTCGCELE